DEKNEVSAPACPRETGNVGEIIAAVLSRKANPLVIGEKTPGLTVEYRDVPLGEDRIMRYAIAEVVLDDDSSIFRTGIEPDIVTPTELPSKHAIFDATESGDSLTKYLYQKQRPRMNEAALVAGIDPEIDYYILRSNGKETPWDKPLPQDRALQQAVDLLNTNAFLESGRKTRP
ncbi:MAG: S41 family peptidase, partial [Verrucomicrobiota bacterium]